MFEEIDLTDSKLAKEFGMGCLMIKGAHLWPLTHFVWEGTAKTVGATFFCDELEPWDKVSLMRIEVFRLPRANAEFYERIEWYSRGRKKRRIKIADGDLFDSRMLAVKGFDLDWEQDAFPLSKGEIIRVYQKKKHAVIFRFLAKSGTMLDHPIFKRVIKNVSFDEKRWEKSSPEVVDSRSKSKRTKESPLTEDQEYEMWQFVGSVMKRLKLSRIKAADKRMGRIEEEITSLRSGEKLSKEECIDRAIVLGSFVGQLFCWELDWEWCNVLEPDGTETVCVCGPDRSLMIDPTGWIFELLTKKKRPLNCVLAFNMIQHGRLPPSKRNGYVRIG